MGQDFLSQDEVDALLKVVTSDDQGDSIGADDWAAVMASMDTNEYDTQVCHRCKQLEKENRMLKDLLVWYMK